VPPYLWVVDSPTSKTQSQNLSPIQQQVVDFFVDGVRVLGLPRSIGEIYGLLFITPNPLSLDDLVEKLDISKGSASQGLRTLKTLGAVRECDSINDRRTYYEPATDLKRLVGGFIREQIRPHLDSGKSKLQLLQETADLSTDSIERAFLNERIERLDAWMKRGKQVLPILQKILGE
jgi:HTH-type transcriptional regulator, glycine betaine synthesis regulator